MTVRHRLAEGNPADEILKAAGDLPADLIVMGTHGRRGLSRMVLGSVAEAVMRKAASPVLTVRVARPTGAENSPTTAPASGYLVPEPAAAGRDARGGDP